MQRGERDSDLISFLEFCHYTSNLQVDLNFPDDVLAVAHGDPLQNVVGQVDLYIPDDVLVVAQGDPLQNDVSQVDLNFPHDVHVIAQNDPLQNDTSLENRNLIQNPNPSLLNPYPNQNQEHGLFSPFEGMHLQPNFNNLMEPGCQPYYQLNPELCMPSNQNYMARPPCPTNVTNVTNVASISRGETDISRSSCRRRDGITMNRPGYQPFEGMHLHPNFNNLMEPGYPYYQLNPELCMPSNQNYMARPPCPTNVTNVASISRGETDISHSSRRRRDGITMNRPTYSGTGNSASEPMQQNIEGFLRNTRMRVDPGQGRTSIVAVSPNTTQYNMVFSGPNPNTGQPMSNPALASNTLSIPLARTNTTLRQPMSSRGPASNTLSIPLARPNPNPGQLITLGFNPPSIPPARGNSIPSPNLSQSRPVALPELADLTNQRTTSSQQPIRAIASSDASQIRSHGVFLHQAVPLSIIPSVPASPALSVSVRDHTASTSQTGNSGAWDVFIPSEERPSYLPPIRIMFPRGTSSTVALNIQARLNREIMARNLVRDLYPDADERQLVTLLSATREMLDEWREIDRHIDMRLDIDHMSHEELMALEERIGSVRTGVSEEIVNEHMRQRPFSDLLENDTDPCCICQEEYVEDDQVGTLECGHNFHGECIKKWLGQKNVCPICKKLGIDI